MTLDYRRMNLSIKKAQARAVIVLPWVLFFFSFFSLGLLVPSFIPLLRDVDPQMAGRVHLSLREIANESQTSVLPRFCL